MLKLQDLLQLKEYRRYRPTKRFWYFLLIMAGYIVLAFLLDKPDSYFTSVYWRG